MKAVELIVKKSERDPRQWCWIDGWFATFGWT
jgi:hypothetical protein